MGAIRWIVMRTARYLCLTLLCTAVLGCTTFPRDAMQVSPEMLATRECQTRTFDSGGEISVLSACAAVLQDTGFTLEESELSIGVITASKTRNVPMDGKQVAKMAAMILGMYIPVEKEEIFTACVMTCPRAGKRVTVRVAFRCETRDIANNTIDVEILGEADLYQEFFSRLSKALFLQEQGI